MKVTHQMQVCYQSAIDKLVKYGEDAAEYLTDQEKVTIILLSGVKYSEEVLEDGDVKITAINAGVTVVESDASPYGYKYRVYRCGTGQ